MVQLQVLSGRKAGVVFTSGKFPCAIGRGGECDFCLEDAGVWERHLELQVYPDQGVAVRLFPPALGTVNGYPFEHVLLRSGDLIEVGEVRLRFSLSDPEQRSLRLREALTWFALGLLCLAQFVVIYQLLP